MKDQDEVAITCEFCNARYAFDSIDIEQLFRGQEFISPGPTKH
jgi:hypothetical protein